MEEPVNTNNTATTPLNGDDNILIRTIDKLSTPAVYFFTIFIGVFLTVCMAFILFSGPFGVNLGWLSSFGLNVNMTLLGVIGIIILVVTIVVIIMLLYVKTFKSILQIIDKLGWVFLLLAFIASLVLCSIYIKPTILDRYKYFILTIVALVASNVFYKALQQSDEEKFFPNLQVEKIRFSLVYFAFIVFVLLMFFTNIGGVRSNLLGQSFVFTLVLLILGFVYLLNLLSFPIVDNPTDKTKSLISGFTWFGFGHFVFFILTVIGFFVGIYTNKGKFVDQSGKLSFKNLNFASICVLFVVIMLLWIVFFLVRTTGYPTDVLTGFQQKRLNSVANITQQAVNIVLGLSLLGLIIGWSITLAENYKKDDDLSTLLVNIATVMLVVYFAYKFLANVTHFQRSPYYKLLVNTIFYIPCLFYEIFAWLFSKIGVTLPTIDELMSGEHGVNIGTKRDLIMLGTIIFVNIAYFIILPYTVNKIAKQGGHVLQMEPIDISSETTLGTYLKLNGYETKDNIISEVNAAHNYMYAISFWVYLDSNQGTNTNEYYTILNYEEIPHIKWNPTSSELIVTVKSQTNPVAGDIRFPEGLDPDGNVIMYRSKPFKTQKWNNIILNFDSGTFDIFINGELVKTKKQVVPKITYGTLVCGSSQLTGSICNIVYFNFALTMTKVHYLYNLVKFNNPPIPTNTSLGRTEEVISKSLGGQGKKNIIIPITLETDIFDDITLDTPVEKLNLLTTSKYRNYLSLGWYFKHNKDENNAYTSNDAPLPNPSSSDDIKSMENTYTSEKSDGKNVVNNDEMEKMLKIKQ